MMFMNVDGSGTLQGNGLAGFICYLAVLHNKNRSSKLLCIIQNKNRKEIESNICFFFWKKSGKRNPLRSRQAMESPAEAGHKMYMSSKKAEHQ